VELLDDADATEAEDLRLLVHQVWNMYYTLGEDRDLGFDLGIICYQLNLFQDALYFFEHSLAQYGPCGATYYNLSSCFYQLGKDDAALHFIDETLAINPGHEGALCLQGQLRVMAS
jgi:tetratricopeptide (TPR) repeat protein